MQPHRPHEKGVDEDFGIKPDQAAKYARQKGDDHPGRPAGDKMLGAGNSAREHGVGSTGGHAGKGSGGDIDPDLLGLEPLPGCLDSETKTPEGRPNVGGAPVIGEGDVTFSGADAEERGDHDNSQSGGGIANNRGSTQDDSFVSEVTQDEANGKDQSAGGGG